MPVGASSAENPQTEVSVYQVSIAAASGSKLRKQKAHIAVRR